MRLGSSAGLLVLLLAVGCAGDHASFTEDYNKAVTPISELGQRPGGKPRDVDELARRANRTAWRLRRLRDVPEEARDELEMVSFNLERVASSLDAVAEAQRQRRAKLQELALDDLRETNRDYKRAEAALQRAVED